MLQAPRKNLSGRDDFRSQIRKNGPLRGSGCWSVVERRDGSEWRESSDKGFTVSGRKNKEFDDLLEHVPWMRTYARRLVSPADVEDVVIVALHMASRPTGSRPPADDRPRMRKWLRELMRLSAYSYWRMAKKRRAETPWDKHEELIEVPMPGDSEEAIAARECIEIAIDRLPEKYRRVVERHELEGVPLQTLAREYGVRERTVEGWLKRAFKEMRATLVALETKSRKRFGMFVPGWFLRWQRREDAALRESWTQRVWHGIARWVRHPLQWAAHVALAVFCMGLTPHGPRDQEAEPPAMSISPEPVRSAVVAVPNESAPAALVTKALESSGSAALTAVVPIPATLRASSKPKSTVTTQAFASEEDHSLLSDATVAYNRGNYKLALEHVTEHERRFPNSPNARHRETLRSMIMAAMRRKT